MTLKNAIDLLREAGIDSPEYDARAIFKAYGCEAILAAAESDNSELISAIERRAKREPLQ